MASLETSSAIRTLRPKTQPTNEHQGKKGNNPVSQYLPTISKTNECLPSFTPVETLDDSSSPDPAPPPSDISRARFVGCSCGTEPKRLLRRNTETGGSLPGEKSSSLESSERPTKNMKVDELTRQNTSSHNVNWPLTE